MSGYDLILRGGTLVTGAGQTVADLAVRDGRIEQIGDLGGAAAASEVDAEGKLILPGFIDTQVHFREPGLEHKEDIESGSRAAICGGVTTFFEMPNTQPATIGAEELEDKLNRAKGRAWADHAFFMGASPENAERLAELERLPGTPGVKIFMGSSTGSLLVDDEDLLRRVLENGERPCPVHSEDEARMRERKSLISADPHPREHPYLRDAEAAVISTKRLIRLSRETGRPVHVLHISTRDELPILAEAKAEGLRVTCEATPQHMLLEASLYESLGSLLQMNPPVRAEEHRAAIFRAVQDGLFDVFGSDHAPHTLEEKSRPYPSCPSGMPGVQTILPLLLDQALGGAFPLEQLVRMGSERPASLYGLAKKGTLEPGMDADLVLVDPGGSWTIAQADLQARCGWSPYVGRTLRGRIESVWLRGRLASQNGRPAGDPSGASVDFTWK